MKTDNLLVFVAALAAFSALFAAGFSYYSLSSFRDTWVTGYAFSQANATINVTVASLLSLNFTNRSIFWGSGYVNEGSLLANLTTYAGAGTISATGGSWSINPANGSNGFELVNIGNVNATINLKTLKNVTQFFGSGTGALYLFNITEIETGSCLNNTGGTFPNNGSNGLTTFSLFQNVNTTDPGTPICGRLRFSDSTDSIRVDVRLGIPYDATNGTLSDTFVMAYCEAPGPCS